MALLTNNESDIFSDYSKKQKEKIVSIIKGGDYTQVYQRYICGIIGRGTDIRYRDDLVFISEGNTLSLCSISEMNTHSNVVIILRKIKGLSDFLNKKYSSEETVKFPCFDEFVVDVKNWLLDNWKINSYNNSIDEDPILAFKSGNVNITPLRGKMLFEYLFNEEGFDFDFKNLGLNNVGWLLRKYFFLSEEERLDLKNYSLKQLQNGRFCYILHLVVFLDPVLWSDDYKSTLKFSEKAQELLKQMIQVVETTRSKNLIFSGKLSDEIEGEILGINRE